MKHHVVATTHRPTLYMNICSGRIMVSIPNDHFGPIPASADPRGMVSFVVVIVYSHIGASRYQRQNYLMGSHNYIVNTPINQSTQGIKVGEWWKDRLDCRQWGAHFPHVAGIAGQSNVGAQSVVLSGGYDRRCHLCYRDEQSARLLHKHSV